MCKHFKFVGVSQVLKLKQDEKLSERLSGTVKVFQKRYLRLSADRKPIL